MSRKFINKILIMTQDVIFGLYPSFWLAACDPFLATNKER
jgi:hypothetical protein